LQVSKPAFALDGDLIYFAAFKKHIGICPPVNGDEKLSKELARHRGEKGNLKFPLDEPILTRWSIELLSADYRSTEEGWRQRASLPARFFFLDTLFRPTY
jgi:hypothetical protein